MYEEVAMSNDFVRSYLWSISSLCLSVGSIIALYTIVIMMTSRGSWNPYSDFSYILRACYGLTSVSSLILAVFGLRDDRRVWMGLIALLLSLFAIFILVTAD